MYKIGKEEIDAVAAVIEAGNLFKINSGLRESEHAEEEMREKFGVDHAILMTSGHAALTSALIALGSGPGDQVIVPAYTYISTALAVVGAGAIPVIAEADETLTISPADMEKKITKHTKAIMPVHIQGFPCNMDAIMEIAKKHNLYVVEDACQADGGTYNGKRLGTIGDAGAYSFNYFKVISCGEGGALLTNNRTVFERALIYHDSAAVAYFGNQLDGVESSLFCGTEYRTNEIAAAILRKQLVRLDDILANLRKVRDYFMTELKDLCKFIPSYDINGGCATTLAIRFDSAERTTKFMDDLKANDLGCTVPINTGKHIYSNWTPIINKVGALNPLMDPFKMEANKDIIPDYSVDMCPETLDLLARTAYVPLQPYWTEAEIAEKLDIIKKALA